MSMKNSNDTIGYRSHDLQFVALCLNHCTTANPKAVLILFGQDGVGTGFSPIA
jgi:hypothetical protein